MDTAATRRRPLIAERREGVVQIQLSEVGLNDHRDGLKLLNMLATAAEGCRA
jgi:hypothetical protein